MRRTLIFCLLALPFSLSFSGCKLDELSETIVVPEVEDEFYVDLWQTLGEEEAGLVLRMRTIAEEDCLNYEIGYQYSRNGNRVRISIEKILPPADCEEGQAPARAEVPLADLSPGFHDFDIALRNTVNNDGQLVISSDQYRLSFDDAAGIILLHSELRRVPPTALWGYVHFPQAAGASAAEAFLTELASIVPESELTDGYYGHFTVHRDQARPLTLPAQPNPAQTFTFLHEMPADLQTEVRQLLDTYRADYPELDFALFTGEGAVW